MTIGVPIVTYLPKRRVESFIVSYVRRLQIYHCVQLNALFCCLWRDVEASCHKHFVFSRKPPSLTTSNVSQLIIAISAYSICIRRPR